MSARPNYDPSEVAGSAVSDNNLNEASSNGRSETEGRNDINNNKENHSSLSSTATVHSPNLEGRKEGDQNNNNTNISSLSSHSRATGNKEERKEENENDNNNKENNHYSLSSHSSW